MDQEEQIRGLDGKHRQSIANNLWLAWRERSRPAAILTGFSGVGKTDRVVRPLIAKASKYRLIAICIEAPINPISIDDELKSLVLSELKASGLDDIALKCANSNSFNSLARELLRMNALLVIDEFQRLLDPESRRPKGSLSDELVKLARRTGDSGCLWLVSNQEVDPGWAEPFHLAHLYIPEEQDVQIRIVLEALNASDANARFPLGRRVEVIERLGGNPRALRLLGQLLRNHAINDLLGEASLSPIAPNDPLLVLQLERHLVSKAAQGLSQNASRLLQHLAVLIQPANWLLLSAIGKSFTNLDPGSLINELQDRFLLDSYFGKYLLHPAVREVEGIKLREKTDEWKVANDHVGDWYASAISKAIQISPKDSEIATHLSALRFHYTEANAIEKLRVILLLLKDYIDEKFGWSSRTLHSSDERNAAISLLEVFLIKPGSTGVEYTYAKMLFERNAPGDATLALPHAKYSTKNRDHNHPWVLLIKVVRQVEGINSAIIEARDGIRKVGANKGLYAIYQLLGSCLVQIGQPEHAVDALLEGLIRCETMRERLGDEALMYAAAEQSDTLLDKVREQISGYSNLKPALAFSEVLIAERAGRWGDAANLAGKYRESAPFSYYFPLLYHETLCWLGSGHPQAAQESLNRFPRSIVHKRGYVITWLAAISAVLCGDTLAASNLLSIYSGEITQTSLEEMQISLLCDWDQETLSSREPNPSLVMPILPICITGLLEDIRRSQYGPLMLEKYKSQPQSGSSEPNEGKMKILSVATEWTSGKGGLSTLNRNLCISLAAAGAWVVCLVESDGQITGTHEGVFVLAAPGTPGVDQHYTLMRKPKLPLNFLPDVVIGHGRVTGPAAQILVADHFQNAKRLHFIHMAPDEIEWLKDGREDDSGQRAEERTRIEIDLARDAAGVVAIGPKLHARFERELNAAGISSPYRLDPGFEQIYPLKRTPPLGSPWAILMLGRLDDYSIKGLDLAAKALGGVVNSANVSSRLELIVRGAQLGTTDKLRDQLREWANAPKLDITVRPYSIDKVLLDEDMLRASLVLMPSRTEGFGLVGLEAIIAGTPTLVSSESGLGELLKETLTSEQFLKIVVQTSSDESRNVKSWCNAIERVLINRKSSFNCANEIQTVLAKQRTWEMAASSILSIVQTK